MAPLRFEAIVWYSSRRVVYFQRVKWYGLGELWHSQNHTLTYGHTGRVM